MRMNIVEARRLLAWGLEPVTLENIDAAFRAAVRAHHPDNGGPGADMAKLGAARDHLRQVVTGAELSCKTCGGEGSVRAKLGRVPCGACKGTGERRL